MRLLPLVLVVGCAPAATDSRALDEGAAATPTITFAADWTVTLTGTLVAGAPAQIVYDVARQPDCRATYNGLPAWAIAADWNADGGWGHSTGITSGQATITVPAGHDLQLWFHASDEHGCSTWDSAYGANYHFPIDSPPILHFRYQDFAVQVDGTPHAGDDVMIDYELARLPWCRQDYNGYQTWDVLAHWRFDGGAVSDGSVTEVVGTSGRDQAPLRIHTPAGAHELEIWFENTDRTGCDAWDSDYGRNFHFALQ